MVNKAFGVGVVRAGAGEVSLLQPEIRDLVVVGQVEVAVNVFEKPRA